MAHEERKVEAADGIALHVECWRPEGDPTFAIVIAHGAAEHIGRYAPLAERWNAQGALVFGPDHRGQGLSGGSTGHVDAFETYARDLRTVVEDIAKELPQAQRPGKIPWFLLGHSMGGLIALTYLLDHEKAVPLAGAIISAPLIEPAVKVGAVKRFAANIMMSVAPKVALPTGIPAEDVARDPEIVAAYKADERRKDGLTAGWLRAMQAAVARVGSQATDIELPMRWYVGSGDRIVSPEAVQRAFDGLEHSEARDQSLVVFDGYFHEMHHELPPQRDEVLSMLDEWLSAHR